jgi:ubiquinone/menaquinone biosynthesis C-methylase UbiE
MDLFKHYRKLAHFSLLLLRGDLTGDNVRLMREYYAQVVLGEVRDLLSIDNKRVLDVGGADGTFCKVFHNELGGEAINLDFHATCANLRWRDSVRGSAHKLPFNDNMFDLVLCRGYWSIYRWNGNRSL